MLKKRLLWLLFTAFLLRLVLVPFWVKGDLHVFFEWGEKFWQYGARDFYLNRGWTYSFPTYPPISSLMYGAAFKVWDQRYLLALLHNEIRLPPAFLIIWIQNWGQWFLIKLPVILADLGLGYLIYKLVFELTKNKRQAFLAAAFYLFNPVTLFLSGVWGQTESLIALFGISSFYFLVKGRPELSLPLFFAGLYIKPTWIIFVPLYILFFLRERLPFKKALQGAVVSFLIFLLVTYPFSGTKFFGFTKKIVTENILPSAKGTAKASISAFNLHTVFLTYDKDVADTPILGIPANLLGIIAFGFIYLFSIRFMLREEDRLLRFIGPIFFIGLGGFLFLTNMLERYFFTAFTSLVVLVFVRPRLAPFLVLLNLGLFLNLIYAYFRRDEPAVNNLFTSNNFLLLRTVSLASVLSYISILYKTAVSFKK